LFMWGLLMKSLTADVVICGAGIGGISAAYHLTVKQGIENALIVDDRPPLSLTSDKSTEAYRNWWPGPGDTMVRFMNRSIDLLENLAGESDNFFRMNRRGYVFVTADPKKAILMQQTAREISQLGAGPVRCHEGHPGNPHYSPSPPQGFDPELRGADLVTDPALIRKHFPFISDKAIAMLHPRRCGWLNAQQLGMYLLEHAREHGARFIKGRVFEVAVGKGQIEGVHVRTEDGTTQISTRAFVIAAGPLLKSVGTMIGLDLPVLNELHGKIAFNDPAGIIPRDAPLMIWTDPAVLPWTEEERSELTGSDKTKWLLDEFPGGVHFRPEGGPDSKTILALWTYDIKPQAPVWPPVFEPEYGEVVLRGLGVMVPGLIPFLGKIGKPVVDGGYYCKAQENRPLIGPLPVRGAFLIGALSGFGIMASMGAGELLGIHVAGGELPAYAPSFLLSRYEDPEYQKLLASWDATSGQL
jgi:glycine/D-amino acid oxidase-like deaminating enzyme